MKKKPNIMPVILFLTGLLCIAALLFFSYTTYEQMESTEKDLAASAEYITKIQQEIKEDEEIFTAAVEKKQAALKYQQQKALTAHQKKSQERAPEYENEETSPSVFSRAGADEFSDTPAAENGHVIGIDPGHQSESVDMSELEPNGPGSSEMKAKASTGTQGSYTGVLEYELNLQVSLKLRDILEQRGYQVVMTRTDNDTAISNKERAQYVAEQGAEIYVRIHANGDDSHTVSGALSMSPSSQNPYIPQLYDASNRLSQCILDSYCQATGFQNLGIQYYDNMTGINWSSVPVTILEMGFMTYESDDRQMNDASFQDTMAEGIANGIDAYFNS
ncbi:MAG: N-acetylmuramoyl-L-alanine amidase [Eubacteriales bacterium]|nr:N-acetylmuramoyl-L-alanine amidase [Eubacteriales bacterium]